MAIKKQKAPQMMSEDVFESSMEELESILGEETEAQPKPAAKPSAEDKDQNKLSFRETEEKETSPKTTAPPKEERKPPEEKEVHDTREKVTNEPSHVRSPGHITKRYSGDIVEHVLENMVKKERMKDAEPEVQEPIESMSSQYLLVSETTGEVFVIDRELILGSDMAAVDIVVIGNKTVSRKHAKITPAEDGIYIEDIGSRNGTMVNGVLIPQDVPIKVEEEDVITFSDENYVLKK